MKKKNLFKDCKETAEDVFQSEQHIKTPTLLINAEFETHNKFLRIIGLKEILPINNFVSLRLYFKNLYDAEIEKFDNVPFIIEYPNGKQYRPWKINIPNLKKKGDCFFSETKILFKPEIPGVHRLIIGKIDGFQYADLYGVTDRDYKQIATDWTASFQIYNSLELRFYVTAILALIVSVLALLFSLS